MAEWGAETFRVETNAIHQSRVETKGRANGSLGRPREGVTAFAFLRDSNDDDVAASPGGYPVPRRGEMSAWLSEYRPVFVWFARRPRRPPVAH